MCSQGQLVTKECPNSCHHWWRRGLIPTFQWKHAVLGWILLDLWQAKMCQCTRKTLKRSTLSQHGSDWSTKVTTKRWQLAIVGSDTCSNYSLCGEINVSETLETILATCLSIWWRVEESAFPMWTKKQLSRPQHKFCAFASPFCLLIYRVCLQVHLWALASTLSLWRLETSWHQQFRLGTLGEFVRISARPQPNMVQQSHQIMIYLIRH